MYAANKQATVLPQQIENIITQLPNSSRYVLCQFAKTTFCVKETLKLNHISLIVSRNSTRTITRLPQYFHFVSMYFDIISQYNVFIIQCAAASLEPKSQHPSHSAILSRLYRSSSCTPAVPR